MYCEIKNIDCPYPDLFVQNRKGLFVVEGEHNGPELECATGQQEGFDVCGLAGIAVVALASKTEAQNA